MLAIGQLDARDLVARPVTHIHMHHMSHRRGGRPCTGRCDSETTPACEVAPRRRVTNSKNLISPIVSCLTVDVVSTKVGVGAYIWICGHLHHDGRQIDAPPCTAPCGPTAYVRE